MRLEEALREIREFWSGPFPFTGGGGAAHIPRLAAELGGASLPPELEEYIASVIPASPCTFELLGSPLDVYGFEQLSRRADGYSHHGITGKRLPEWSDDWFLVGDEGADPYIVLLSNQEPTSPVLHAIHGIGEWIFTPLTDSLGQFLLLAAARHHAITVVAKGDAFENIKIGYALREPAASWLFPRVREWAPSHYDHWVGELANARRFREG